MITRPLFALFLILTACTPKPSPEPAITITPSPKEHVAKAVAKSGPNLSCPAGTEQKENHIAKGTEHYCVGDKGKSGPSWLTNKAGKVIVKREYTQGISTGSLALFHEGKALATGTFEEGWLASLTYNDAPPVHRGPDFFLVESEIRRAGVCKADSDCMSQLGKCPLGCDLVFNKAHKSKVDTWLKAFKGNCQYRCMAQKGALKCEYGQCVRTHH